MERLKPLEPQRIGGVFRPCTADCVRRDARLLTLLPRPLRRTARLLVRLLHWPLTAKTKILLISLVVCVTLLGLADAAGVLGPSHEPHRRWALDYVFSRNAEPAALSLPLLQDPAGLVVLAVVLITPVFCCQQVRAIADFVPMNERNGGAARLTPEQVERLNRLVDATNRWFGALGRRRVSAAVALTMAIGVCSLYGIVNTHGLMESWNPTGLPDRVWRSEVYDGWWANRHTHPELAAALCAAGTYAFYFLAKQLVMGVVFTVYLYRSKDLGFGVTPNMNLDSDGFQGLRTLRQFMLWTYGSALAHMIGLLVLFTVWLSAAAWMVFIVLGVMVLDMLVIVYPSSIGYHSALAVKQDHVQTLYRGGLPRDEADAAIARVWAVPVLPVGTRKAMTGITLYLLVPAFVGLVPVLFQRL
ncbi:hypothetical protein ABZT17_36645 [Streptomyces sp. NPDC005648]|uniref:hypothetical protein n=1 Tax=Streptomyces sp. NPDC005648 TaxID=3157044 RepID=UPI0033B18919